MGWVLGGRRMRAFKFRAWINKAWGEHKSEMIYGFDSDPYTLIWFEHKLGLSHFTGCTNISWVMDSQYYTLMQFTGLHDKNGKEIWEGDIVASSHTPNQIVEYEHDRFVLRPDNYDLWKVCEYWEVIGNIYENPERS
jgi:uncharacterized phage protein (TIGR01671 family)